MTPKRATAVVGNVLEQRQNQKLKLATLIGHGKHHMASRLNSCTRYGPENRHKISVGQTCNVSRHTVGSYQCDRPRLSVILISIKDAIMAYAKRN
eukprot:scaffold411836_cov21-Prasinocladus_malaysianus.AAC.2